MYCIRQLSHKHFQITKLFDDGQAYIDRGQPAVYDVIGTDCGCQGSRHGFCRHLEMIKLYSDHGCPPGCIIDYDTKIIYTPFIDKGFKEFLEAS